MEAAFLGEGGERRHSRASAKCHLVQEHALLQPVLTVGGQPLF